MFVTVSSTIPLCKKIKNLKKKMTKEIVSNTNIGTRTLDSASKLHWSSYQWLVFLKYINTDLFGCMNNLCWVDIYLKHHFCLTFSFDF